MPSFGAKLKLEREKRKITLEQISHSTKIGTRMLQALEEDNFNQLPGGIFNRGFVRAYSRFLGLDEDQTIADYMQASGDAPPVSTEPASREDGSHENATRENQDRESKDKDKDKDKDKVSRLEASADAPPRQVPWGVFAGALLVVALALSFWSHRRREHMKQADRPTPVTVETQASGPVSGSDLPTTSAPPTSSPSGPSGVPRISPDLAPASPAATPGEFTVVIQAREESWTTITADGKTISSELLPAGSERVVRGRKEITVRTGNAGGVDFRFHEKKVDIGGDYGEVKTVTFGPRGILPNPPQPPSTP